MCCFRTYEGMHGPEVYEELVEVCVQLCFPLWSHICEMLVQLLND